MNPLSQYSGENRAGSRSLRSVNRKKGIQINHIFNLAIKILLILVIVMSFVLLIRGFFNS